MENNHGLPPIKNVFKIIDSCINEKQLKTCLVLIDHYSQMAKRKGIVNHSLIRETLQIKIQEKRHELKLADKFRGKIRRRKIKVAEIEKEIAENFS